MSKRQDRLLEAQIYVLNQSRH